MMAAIKSLNEKHLTNLSLKIAIGIGPISAGVIGAKVNFYLRAVR